MQVTLGKPVLSFIAPAFRLLCHAHPLGERVAGSIQRCTFHQAFPGIHVHLLLLGSSGTLGGRTPELLLGLGLEGPLGPADGAGAGDGGLPEVGAVAVLGDLVGNGLVGLARGLVAAVGDLVQARGGLVGRRGLPADHLNTALLVGDDADSLVIGEAGELASMHVRQVEGVPGELGTEKIAQDPNMYRLTTSSLIFNWLFFSHG